MADVLAGTRVGRAAVNAGWAPGRTKCLRRVGGTPIRRRRRGRSRSRALRPHSSRRIGVHGQAGSNCPINGAMDCAAMISLRSRARSGPGMGRVVEFAARSNWPRGGDPARPSREVCVPHGRGLYFPARCYSAVSRRDGRVVEGAGLENRRAKAPWVRILLPPPFRSGEVAEWLKAAAC
jgi:hypothetical protein